MVTKKETLINTIIYVIILVVATVGLVYYGRAVNNRQINRTKELCKYYNKEAKENPLFYVTENQAETCKTVGIKIKAEIK